MGGSGSGRINADAGNVDIAGHLRYGDSITKNIGTKIGINIARDVCITSSCLAWTKNCGRLAQCQNPYVISALFKYFEHWNEENEMPRERCKGCSAFQNVAEILSRK